MIEKRIIPRQPARPPSGRTSTLRPIRIAVLLPARCVLDPPGHRLLVRARSSLIGPSPTARRLGRSGRSDRGRCPVRLRRPRVSPAQSDARRPGRTSTGDEPVRGPLQVGDHGISERVTVDRPGVGRSGLVHRLEDGEARRGRARLRHFGTRPHGDVSDLGGVSAACIVQAPEYGSIGIERGVVVVRRELAVSDRELEATEFPSESPSPDPTRSRAPTMMTATRTARPAVAIRHPCLGPGSSGWVTPR